MVGQRWPGTEKEEACLVEGTAGARARSLKAHGVQGNGGCGVQGSEPQFCQPLALRPMYL